jgi:predicted oxidoreductase (fatty acid repression mutant protein)
MIKPNIWGAFQEAGLGFDTSSEPHRIRFSEEKTAKHSRIPGNMVARLPLGETVAKTTKREIWMD